MQAKTWQIALIALGLVVGAAGVLFVTWPRGEVSVSHTMHLVDVSTGQVFKADTRQGPLPMPAPHPETGDMTLVRCFKDDTDGKWKVGRRDLYLVHELNREGVNVTALDPRSGEFLVEVSDVKKYPPRR